MKIIIPLVLLLLGLGGGVGAGFALRPTTVSAEVPARDAADNGAEHAAPEPHAAATPASAGHGSGHGGADPEYIKLNNQFVVPVVTRDKVESLVVMSLSLEIMPGEAEAVYRHEPKLRDEFLQVMFDHANMGGFRGTYTDTGKLALLRTGLFGIARKTLGPAVKGVLITDIVRQDL